VPYLVLLPLMLRLSISAAPVEAPAPNSSWIGVTFVPGASASEAELSSCWRVDFGPADRLAAFQGSAPAVRWSTARLSRAPSHPSRCSFAMLPLFAAEAVVGEKLFNNPNSQGLKTTHAWLNVGILGPVRIGHRHRRLESERRLATIRRDGRGASFTASSC